ncbi:MAG: DUF4031 domain-containing protein [Bacteroidia bacterium]|nr:DUF4031 domain-containing protein [Bacteroidia bacterium]
MALCVDTPKQRTVAGRLRWTAHLISDTSLEELHAFAQALGLPPKAFHNKPNRPHYDLLDHWIGHAITRGAVPLSARALATRLAALYPD